MNVEEFKASDKMPLVVVLDDVRSMYNVGSVFRTADAFRVEAIYLCGITACPPHPEIHKTALGAEDTVEWRYFKDTMEAVADLKARGYYVYSIEQCEGSTKLQELDANLEKRASSLQQEDSPLSALRSSLKSAIIMGNEVKGVKQEVVDASDGCIEIPQFGTKHSLNVSTTAGIVIWEFAKRLIV
jgi:tRNA G18 (ribose-2'-O)-methylase SpoU